MKLLKSSVTIGYLIIATSIIGSSCGHKTKGAALASSEEASASVTFKLDELKIKSYPASTEVTYIDIEMPFTNGGTDSVKGEFNVWIYPADEPEHLVSFLRTGMTLGAGESKSVKPTPSLVRPRNTVKNGEPKLYKFVFEVSIGGHKLQRFEREIEVTF